MHNRCVMFHWLNSWEVCEKRYALCFCPAKILRSPLKHILISTQDIDIDLNTKLLSERGWVMRHITRSFLSEHINPPQWISLEVQHQLSITVWLQSWEVRFQEWQFNWDCATLSHWRPANCKSQFQIIIPHSAGSVCRFWHCQSSDPPVHPLITGHHWDSTSLVWILSHWSVFQGGLGRGGIQSTSTGHWGSPGVSSWTPPLLHIHYITGSHHTGIWFLLPLLRWWHTAVSLFSTRWSNGNCTVLRLPGRHLSRYERISPTAQPGKD